jgi:hypothetical protein
VVSVTYRVCHFCPKNYTKYDEKNGHFVEITPILRRGKYAEFWQQFLQEVGVLVPSSVGGPLVRIQIPGSVPLTNGSGSGSGFGPNPDPTPFFIDFKDVWWLTHCSFFFFNYLLALMAGLLYKGFLGFFYYLQYNNDYIFDE